MIDIMIPKVPLGRINAQQFQRQRSSIEDGIFALDGRPTNNDCQRSANFDVLASCLNQNLSNESIVLSQQERVDPGTSQLCMPLGSWRESAP